MHTAQLLGMIGVFVSNFLFWMLTLGRNYRSFVIDKFCTVIANVLYLARRLRYSRRWREIQQWRNPTKTPALLQLVLVVVEKRDEGADE